MASSDRIGPGAAPSLKVLDFGLGKALAPLRHDTALHGLTGTSPGILLGTAAYMSPEQARAEVVDERADIWAFGCVLFEMLTGTRAFPGRTAAEVLGNIVEREPAFSLLPENTPASIRRLLRRSLEKQLPRRLSCMRDAILELDDATLPALEPAVRRPPSVAAFVAAIAAIGIVAALVLQTMRRPEPVPQPVARFAVPLPPGDRPAIGLQPVVALSPDGRTLVYAAQRGDTTALFRRDLATLEPSLVAGTEGGTSPFFSPDGRWLGFVANGELKRISMAGGPAETIAPAAGEVTAAWMADDAIVFSTTATRVLHRVPASGGTPAALTTLNLAQGRSDSPAAAGAPWDAKEFRKSSRKRCAPLHDHHRVGTAGRGSAARYGRNEHPDDRNARPLPAGRPPDVLARRTRCGSRRSMRKH